VSVNLPKTLMVLLLCLAFISQVMASTVMSYQMMNMKGMSMQEQPHERSKMDHRGHQMMNDSDESTEECCSSTCNCSTSGCSSIAIFNKDISRSLAIGFASKIMSVSRSPVSQPLTSLYRPPILS